VRWPHLEIKTGPRVKSKIWRKSHQRKNFVNRLSGETEPVRTGPNKAYSEIGGMQERPDGGRPVRPPRGTSIRSRSSL